MVAHELLQGLVACDPVSPRVSLATIRALRRAEQSHVERVTAAVQACIEHNRRTGTHEGDRRVLADLAPFECRAAERLLARTSAGLELTAEARAELPKTRGGSQPELATAKARPSLVRRLKRRLPW